MKAVILLHDAQFSLAYRHRNHLSFSLLKINKQWLRSRHFLHLLSGCCCCPPFYSFSSQGHTQTHREWLWAAGIDQPPLTVFTLLLLFDTLIATDQSVHTMVEVPVLGNATESWLNGSEVDTDLLVCPAVDIIHSIRKYTNTGKGDVMPVQVFFSPHKQKSDCRTQWFIVKQNEMQFPVFFCMSCTGECINSHLLAEE